MDAADEIEIVEGAGVGVDVDFAVGGDLRIFDFLYAGGVARHQLLDEVAMSRHWIETINVGGQAGMRNKKGVAVGRPAYWPVAGLEAGDGPRSAAVDGIEQPFVRGKFPGKECPPIGRDGMARARGDSFWRDRARRASVD